MLGQAKTIHLHPTASELEALILEANLIHDLKPRYNSRLKDDKSPLYIAITAETYPRVLALRKSQIIGGGKIASCFGPFPSGHQVQQLLLRLRRLFPFCTQARQQQRRPCFYYHLHLCPGACIGTITPAAYRRGLQPLILLLQGHPDTARRYLTRLMHQAARAHRFEAASEVHQQLLKLDLFTQASRLTPDWQPSPASQPHQALTQLRQVLAAHLPHLSPQLTRIEAYDISNLSGQFPTASLAVFIHGQADKSAYRRFKLLSPGDDVTWIKQALTRRLRHPEWGSPDLILIDGGLPQLSAATAALPARLPVITLAKRQEIVYLPGQPPLPLRLPLHSSALKLLQRLRDEAHRFARAYHRKLRDTIKS